LSEKKAPFKTMGKGVIDLKKGAIIFIDGTLPENWTKDDEVFFETN
jgi:hypothetical protein